MVITFLRYVIYHFRHLREQLSRKAFHRHFCYVQPGNKPGKISKLQYVHERIIHINRNTDSLMLAEEISSPERLNIDYMYTWNIMKMISK